MVVDQVRNYLEHGNIRNAVNFPDVVMERESADRVAIANANVPTCLGKSHCDGCCRVEHPQHAEQIHARDSHTLVDVDSPVSAGVIRELSAIKGVERATSCLSARMGVQRD
jgi:D-3-phosphoglycerate dehydrogenase